MESERGIIIIGNCRSGKMERVLMMQQLLKERPEVIAHGFDFAYIESNTESDVRKLNMSFQGEVKLSQEAIKKLKQALEQAGSTFNGSKMYLYEAKEMFEEMKQAVIQEKPQSKFISRPRHNFRKR